MNQQNNKQYLEKHDELLWITVVIQTSQKGREKKKRGENKNESMQKIHLIEEINS